MKELDIATLVDIATDPTTYREANQRETVPTGAYRLKIEQAIPQENEETGERSARFSGTLHDRETGEFRGRFSYFATWETRRRPDGTLTGESKRWGMTAKALGLPENAPVVEVLARATQFPLDLRISETYVVEGPDDTTRFVNAPLSERAIAAIEDDERRFKAKEYKQTFEAERASAVAQGYTYEARNFVQRIWAAK